MARFIQLSFWKGAHATRPSSTRQEILGRSGEDLRFCLSSFRKASLDFSQRGLGQTRVPHICPVLADVGFHQPQPLTVQGVDGHGQDLLLVASDRWTAVESHICQNRADGAPVTRYALRSHYWQRFV